MFDEEKLSLVRNLVSLNFNTTGIRTGPHSSKLKERVDCQRSSLEKILTNLKHENIESLFCPSDVKTGLYYEEKITLNDYLDKICPLDEQTIISFSFQLGKGMKKLRQNNIVHRDIKPENILLSFTDKTNIVLRISGFSLSTILKEGEFTEGFYGTILYMAPEVLLFKKYDAKCDLWSIGVTLYECLTGKVPFDVLTFHELEKIYENKKPQIDTSKLNDCKLKILFSGLLKIKSNERINFKEFFNHLDNFSPTSTSGSNGEN